MANMTIISVPLPFEGVTDIRQRNAIRSWMLVEPRPEIVLFVDEKGTNEAAEEFGLCHVPDVDDNTVGDISIRSVFQLGDELATNDLIMFADTDVILMSDFAPVIDYIVKHHDDFTVCAGRWSARISTAIDFSSPEWEEQVHSAVYKQHNYGSDFTIYRRGFFHDIPDFSIGQGYWDGWFMGHTLRRGAALINIADVCKVVHQDHGPSRWNKRPHKQRNRRLSGKHVAWASDATVRLKPEDLCS